MSRLRSFTFVCAAACLPPRNAAACAACACGDPTLVTAGTEQPFDGRLRTSLEFRHRTDAIGEPGVDEIEISELRWDAGLAWAPTKDLFLLANFPLVRRSAVEANLAETRTFGAGDAELRAKAFLYRDRELAPRALFAAVLGLKFPTAPLHRNDRGERLPLEAQAGTGSLDLLAGPSLAVFMGRFSAYGSLQATLPLVVTDDLVPGAALRATLAGQVQVTPWLALRPAGDLRADRPTRQDGSADPHSGGIALFAGGDVLASPLGDLTVSLGARAPVLESLRGRHEEGPVSSAAVAYDW